MPHRPDATRSCADDAGRRPAVEALETLLPSLKAPTDDPRDLIRWIPDRRQARGAGGLPRSRTDSLGPRRGEPGPRGRGLGGADPSRRRWPAGTGRAPRGDRPQPRGAADAEAPGAGWALTRCRGLLLQGDRRDHRLQSDHKTPSSPERVEGRSGSARFSLSRSDGSRSATRWGPAASAFCDGEAGWSRRRSGRASTCEPRASRRATLRAYRAAASGRRLGLPVLPPRLLAVDRPCARNARGPAPRGLATVQRSADSAVSQVAVTRGAPAAPGSPPWRKLLAICAGTAGGAVACLGTGAVSRHRSRSSTTRPRRSVIVSAMVDPAIAPPRLQVSSGGEVAPQPAQSGSRPATACWRTILAGASRAGPEPPCLQAPAAPPNTRRNRNLRGALPEPAAGSGSEWHLDGQPGRRVRSMRVSPALSPSPRWQSPAPRFRRPRWRPRTALLAAAPDRSTRSNEEI